MAALFDRRPVRRVVTGLVAGAIATVVMSCFRVPLSRAPPPPARLWALYVAGEGAPEDYPIEGFALHLVYGVLAGGAFGALAPAIEAESDYERERRGSLLGLCYGLLLSAFGSVVLMDRLLHLDLDDDEAFVFHLGHVVYGLTLGTWFGSNTPRGSRT